MAQASHPVIGAVRTISSNSTLIGRLLFQSHVRLGSYPPGPGPFPVCLARCLGYGPSVLIDRSCYFDTSKDRVRYLQIIEIILESYCSLVQASVGISSQTVKSLLDLVLIT